MEDLKKEKFKNKKTIIISIISTIIILIGAAYAFFTYYKSANAFVLSSNSINAIFSGGTNQISFTNAYPLSDEYALSNLDKLDYIDFTVTGNVANPSEAITYEIYLTEDSNNTLSNNFIKTYVTDNNGSQVVSPTKYSSLTNTTYASAPNGKVILKKTYNNTFTKSYRLYIWLDKDYEQNTVSQNFSFYVNIYAYNDSSENVETTLGETFAKKALQNSSYIKNYTTEFIDKTTQYPGYTTKDMVGTNSNKQDVYYYTGASALENGNVLFAGFCWQIVRTTDTGGLKLIYNGPAESDKCSTSRNSEGTLQGINGKETYVSSRTTTVSGLTNFGTGFTYDLDAKTFTLTGTEDLAGKTWANDSSDLIDTYACSDNATTCSELWYIGHYQSASAASVGKYVIGTDAHYSQIGTSYYNVYYDSPALVGYMYNKVYVYKSGAQSGYHYANSVKYEDGTYTLVDYTENTATAPTAGKQYACDGSEVVDGDKITCSTAKVRFYYYNNYYVLLEQGDTDALYAMLNLKTQSTVHPEQLTKDVEINKYNSAIKGIIDNWYKQNIDSLPNVKGLIDTNAVYCNDRTSSNNYGSWNKDATSKTTYLYFKQSTANKNLGCERDEDSFAVGNTKANLEYPVGLLTVPERELMASGYAATGQIYWGASPRNFYLNDANVHYVNASGATDSDRTINARGVRPVVSLRPDAKIEEGTGTYDSPYVIGPKSVS